MLWSIHGASDLTGFGSIWSDSVRFGFGSVSVRFGCPGAIRKLIPHPLGFASAGNDGYVKVNYVFVVLL